MIPYALGAGALLAALAGWPWGLAGLLLAPLWRDRKAILAFALALALILLRILFLGDPWQEYLGTEVAVSGPLRRGVVYDSRGPIYLDHYPPLADGWVKAQGRVSRPRPASNPGGFDRRAWLRGLGVKAVLTDAKITDYRPPSGFKPALRQRLVAGLTPEAAALTRALTLGERKALGEDRAAFQKAGLAHLLALSGLHIGFLVAFFLLLGLPLGRWRYLTTLALLLAYLALVGNTPSLLRATVMAAIWLLARSSGRSEVPLPALLALSLAVHLLLSPYAIFSLSLWLSYLAVAGILVFTPPRRRHVKPVSWVRDALYATVGAQLAIIPLLLHFFGRLPLLSPVANLAALPLTAALVPLGFIKAFLPGFGFLAPLINLLSSWLLSVARFFSSLPGLSWGQLDYSGFALYYLALLPLALWWHGRLDWKRAAFLMATAVMASCTPAPRPDVWFFDVGEGDSALVRLPGNVEILVDGGHKWDTNRILRALTALGVDDLDLVVATHPDADHAGGVPGLLASFPVGTLVVGPPGSIDPLEKELRQAAVRAGVPVIEAWRGRSLIIGGARLDFVDPLPRPQGEDNERSLAFYLTTRGHRIFFAGDVPASHALAWPPRRVDLLKVSHHGAANGTNDAVIRRLRPRYAWVSVGRKNRFGHPSSGVLALLERYGVEVHRSDREGAWRYPLY
ncbi:DNA internalization-related competence protein ComEC/Rec2 [Oceanithermus sp.]